MAGSFGAWLPFSFSKTVLEMCLYLAGDWPVRLVASIMVLSLGICLMFLNGPSVAEEVTDFAGFLLIPPRPGPARPVCVDED